MTISTGICNNEHCALGIAKERIERYPGPGEYCPSCGQFLDAAPPEAIPSDAPPSAAAASDPPVPRKTRRLLWLFAPLVVVFACGFARLEWASFNVRVCATSMADDAARILLRAYAEDHRQFPHHYSLVSGNDRPCDVRLYTAKNGDASSLIARDGLVAIVNPDNGVRSLNPSQLRDILAGRITDWSQVGGRKGQIIAVIPKDGSDEAREAAAFLGNPIAGSVRRSPAGDILKFVVSPSGSRALGFVPFSTALAAKVIAIAGAPPPSTLSIANERYPLAVRLLADSDYRHPSADASSFIEFAHSRNANRLLLRAAFVTKASL